MVDWILGGIGLMGAYLLELVSWGDFEIPCIGY